VEGCSTESFTCKEITNFSSIYFSRVNNVNAHTMRYQIVEAMLTELKIFQWKGKCVGATSVHFVMDEEWNYITLYMHTNMEAVQPYFDKYDKIY
jgi:hypothetical protein